MIGHIYILILLYHQGELIGGIMVYFDAIHLHPAIDPDRDRAGLQ